MLIWIKRCGKLLACLCGTIVLAACGMVLYLSLSPLSLQPFFPSGKQNLEGEIWRLEYSSLELFFSFGFWLRATDAKLTTKNTGKITELGELETKLNSRALVFGEILPSKVMADNLRLSAERTEEGLSVAGFLLRAQENKTRHKESKPSTDLITVLNEIHDPDHLEWKYLSAIDTFSVKNADIVFDDQVHNRTWHASDLIIGVSNISSGIVSFRTSLTVRKDASEMPVTLELHHISKASSANIRLEISLNDLRLLEGYIPEEIVEAFQGPTTLTATSVLEHGNSLASPNINLNCGKGYVLLPSIFTHKIPFESLNLESTYKNGAKGPTLSVNSFRLLDSEDLLITAEGSITSLQQSPSFHLMVEISPSTVDQMAKYLPDAADPELSQWLDKNLNLARVTSAKFEMNGPISQLPFADETTDSQLKASFDYEGLEVSFWDRAPPGRNLSGQFSMNRGEIIITAKEGLLGNQKVSDLEVTIDKIFEENSPTILSVSGITDGLLPDLVDGFQKRLDNNPLSSFSAEGRQHSNIRVSLPLKPELSYNDVSLSISSTLHNLRVTSSEPPFLYKSEKISTLKVAAHKLSLNSTGLLNGFPVELNLEEDTKSFGKKTKIDIKTKLNHSHLSKYIPPGAATLEGSTDTWLSLRGIEKGQYHFECLSDLDNLGIELNSLNWEKKREVSGRLRFEGTLDPKGKSLSLKTVNASAPKLTINGSGFFSSTKKASSSLQLNPLIIGNTDLDVRYNGQKIDISGRRLDLRSFSMEKETNTKTEIPDIDATFAIKEILLKSITFVSSKGKILRKDNRWVSAKLEGKSSEGMTAALELTTKNGETTVGMRSDDAGTMGELAGIGAKLKSGRLKAEFSSPQGKELSLNQAKGSILMHDVSVIESPLLLQILSYFSLQQWLSTKKGVLFSEIKVPLSRSNEIVTIGDASFEGPWITLRISGTLNTKNKQVKLTGQVVPLNIMGKAVGIIPIIGRTLSNVQRNLTGARFSVSGTTDKPKVSFFGIPVSG